MQDPIIGPKIMWTPELDIAQHQMKQLQLVNHHDPSDEHLQQFWEARHDYKSLLWAARKRAHDQFDDDLRALINKDHVRLRKMWTELMYHERHIRNKKTSTDDQPTPDMENLWHTSLTCFLNR